MTRSQADPPHKRVIADLVTSFQIIADVWRVLHSDAEDETSFHGSLDGLIPQSVAELKAFTLATACLGSKCSAKDAEDLLYANASLCTQQNGRFQIRHCPEMQSVDIKGKTRSIRTRQLWRTYLNQGLSERLGKDAISAAWQMEWKTFVEQLEVTADERLAPPQESVGLQPDDAAGDQGEVAKNAPIDGFTLAQSIQRLDDPRAAYAAACNAECPGCDRDCKTFTELLFHWTKQCKASAKSHVWCGFCRMFYSVSIAKKDLLQHRKACSLQWRQKGGPGDAIKIDSSSEAGEGSESNQRSTSAIDDRLPCMHVQPNFFAQKALDNPTSKATLWYFCPDCVSSQTTTLKASYITFRTPSMLAQHYQCHLVERDRHNVASDTVSRKPHYSPPWRCGYPSCKFRCDSLRERVNHMSYTHEIKLLVDAKGNPQPRAQLPLTKGGERVYSVSQWSLDLLRQSSEILEARDPEGKPLRLYMTRGKAEMQKRTKLAASLGVNLGPKMEAEEDGEGEEEDHGTKEVGALNNTPQPTAPLATSVRSQKPAQAQTKTSRRAGRGAAVPLLSSPSPSPLPSSSSSPAPPHKRLRTSLANQHVRSSSPIPDPIALSVTLDPTTIHLPPWLSDLLPAPASAASEASNCNPESETHATKSNREIRDFFLDLVFLDRLHHLQRAAKTTSSTSVVERADGADTAMATAMATEGGMISPLLEERGGGGGRSLLEEIEIAVHSIDGVPPWSAQDGQEGNERRKKRERRELLESIHHRCLSR